MEQKNEKELRSWSDEHGATIFGVGVFVLLGLIVVVIRVFA
jgi:hypothetical protein